MRSNFEEKRENRIARYQELSSQNGSLSTSLYNASHRAGQHIPMGQPILVGHYSERGHRRALEKINNLMRSSVQASSKSGYYADKAKAAENNKAIFSDDPNAEEKIADKIARLQARQDAMRAANKIVKSKKLSDIQKVEELEKLGYTTAKAQSLLQGDSCGRTGYPDYALTNNNANLNRLKKRLASIEKLNSDTTTEREEKGVRIVDNVEENRLQLFFDGKPSEEVRESLKSNGFRWSPSEGAWQRFRGNHSNWAAERVLEKL